MPRRKEPEEEPDEESEDDLEEEWQSEYEEDWVGLDYLDDIFDYPDDEDWYEET